MNQHRDFSRLRAGEDEAPDNRCRSCPKNTRGGVSGCGRDCIRKRDDENCRTGFGVENGILAALYVPLQDFANLYDLEDALEHGTLFRALDKPFLGGKEGCCRGQQR